MEKPAKWEELGLSGTSWLVSEPTNKEVRKRSETLRRSAAPVSRPCFEFFFWFCLLLVFNQVCIFLTLFHLQLASCSYHSESRGSDLRHV